jgi:hypothetical protein
MIEHTYRELKMSPLGFGEKTVTELVGIRLVGNLLEKEGIAK